MDTDAPPAGELLELLEERTDRGVALTLHFSSQPDGPVVAQVLLDGLQATVARRRESPERVLAAATAQAIEGHDQGREREIWNVPPDVRDEAAQLVRDSTKAARED